MDVPKFIAWLQAQGAEVLATTNGWEIARFKAHGSVHVIYKDARGHISANGFARQCLDAFGMGSNIAMGFTVRRQTLGWKVKQSLLARDGSACFFCTKPVTQEDISVEHLVGIGKGGHSHMDNLALAHVDCNQKANNLPLMEKIKLFARARGAAISSSRVSAAVGGWGNRTGGTATGPTARAATSPPSIASVKSWCRQVIIPKDIQLKIRAPYVPGGHNG